MAGSIWDELGTSMGIKSISVQDVKDAVNNAVSMAAGYKAPVSDQLEKLSGPEAPAMTLEGSVEAMDTPAASRYAAEQQAAPTQAEEHEAHEPEPEEDLGPDV